MGFLLMLLLAGGNGTQIHPSVSLRKPDFSLKRTTKKMASVLSLDLLSWHCQYAFLGYAEVIIFSRNIY